MTWCSDVMVDEDEVADQAAPAYWWWRRRLLLMKWWKTLAGEAELPPGHTLWHEDNGDIKMDEHQGTSWSVEDEEPGS